MGNNQRFRGQASLEALLSFAALLCALCILCYSAQRTSGDFSGSIALSQSRASLSYEALLIDTAADTLSSAQAPFNISGVPAQKGRFISPKGHPTVQEPVFHDVSASQDGKLYVQKNPNEPV